MASPKADTAAEVEIRIAASPETVFDFFTDPDKMILWMGRSAELDPRAGGVLRRDINGRDIARGEYVAVERPDRLVFTWGWEGTQNGDSGHVTSYVRVDDIDASLAKAESLGGTKVMGPMDIPSGQIALFTDPEGHQIGLMTQSG